MHKAKVDFIGRNGRGRGYTAEQAAYTHWKYRETRAKERDNARQPFAGISITHTRHITRDHRGRSRDRDGREGTQEMGKRARKTKGGKALWTAILYFWQGYMHVMMWQNGRGEEV